MRLSARHHVGAEYVGAECVGEMNDLETKLQAVDRTGGRDTSRHVGKPLNEFGGAAHFLQVRTKPVERGGLEIVRKTSRYRFAYGGLDLRDDIVPSAAGVTLQRILETCRVTKIG